MHISTGKNYLTLNFRGKSSCQRQVYLPGFRKINGKYVINTREEEAISSRGMGWALRDMATHLASGKSMVFGLAVGWKTLGCNWGTRSAVVTGSARAHFPSWCLATLHPNLYKKLIFNWFFKIFSYSWEKQIKKKNQKNSCQYCSYFYISKVIRGEIP